MCAAASQFDSSCMFFTPNICTDFMFGLMYLLQACLIDGINELLIELKVGGGFTVYEYDLLGFGFSVFGLYLGVVFGSARSVLADLQQTAGPSAWYPKPAAEMATFWSEVRSPPVYYMHTGTCVNNINSSVRHASSHRRLCPQSSSSSKRERSNP